MSWACRSYKRYSILTPVPETLRFPNARVTVAELAKVLGVTVQGVHYHISHGHIPVIRSSPDGTPYAHLLIEREVAERIVANYNRNRTWSADPVEPQEG
jgi:hypothetical protein